MNKPQGTKMFWRLCGPLLLYWCIQFVAQIVAEMIMIIPHAREIVSAVQWKDAMTDEELQQAMIQMTISATEIFMRYQVQILAAAALCTIPLTAYLFRKDRKQEKEQGGRQSKSIPYWQYIWILALGAVLCVGVTCLAEMTNLAFASESYQETSEVFYSAGIWVQLICLGIVIPVSEELMFRGIFYKRLREQNGFWQAALGTSILFAITHGNIVQFLYAMGLGMLLAYVYDKYQSFKAPVLLHVSANIISIICTETGGFQWIAASPERMAVSVVLCAFAGAVMFVLIQRLGSGSGTTEDVEQDETPGMFR